MAVKAVFAIATVIAVGIALMLPVPRTVQSQEPQRSQIPTMDIGQG